MMLHRLVVVGVSPGAEHHRAEAQRADLQAGAAERKEVVVIGCTTVRVRPFPADVLRELLQNLDSRPLIG